MPSAPAFSLAYRLRHLLHTTLLALAKRLPESRFLTGRPKAGKQGKGPTSQAVKAAAQQLVKMMSAPPAIQLLRTMLQAAVWMLLSRSCQQNPGRVPSSHSSGVCVGQLQAHAT